MRWTSLLALATTLAALPAAAGEAPLEPDQTTIAVPVSPGSAKDAGRIQTRLGFAWGLNFTQDVDWTREQFSVGYDTFVGYKLTDDQVLGGFLNLGYNFNAAYGDSFRLAVGPRWDYYFLTDWIRPFVGAQAGLVLQVVPQHDPVLGGTAGVEGGLSIRVDGTAFIHLATGYSFLYQDMPTTSLSMVHVVPFNVSFSKAF